MVFFILFYFGCDNSGPKYIVNTNPIPQITLSASTDSIFVAGPVSLNVDVEDLEKLPEKRFTKEQIKKMMINSDFENIKFSNEPPYWCVVGTKK